MSQFIDSIIIERKAKKAFHQDHSDKEEFEADAEEFPSRFLKMYPEIAKNFDQSKSVKDEDSDVMYMGGEKKPT